MSAGTLWILIMGIIIIIVTMGWLSVHNMRILIVSMNRGNRNTFTCKMKGWQLARVIGSMLSVIVSMLIIILMADVLRYYVYLYKGVM